jgi:hypothetical protein
MPMAEVVTAAFHLPTCCGLEPSLHVECLPSGMKAFNIGRVKLVAEGASLCVASTPVSFFSIRKSRVRISWH